MMPQIRRSGPPAQEGRPVHNSDTHDSNRLHRPEDGWQAPDFEDRSDAAFEAEAKARGYRLSLTCLDCGHPIVAEASLRRLRGPRCAARAEAGAVAE